MKRALVVGWFGFRELVRARLFVNVLAAGVALVVASLAFEELSAGQGGRVLVGIGLAFVALLSSVLGGVVAVTTAAREIDSRQVNTLLAHPFSRGEYVVARFVAAALLVVSASALLGLLLSVLTAAVAASVSPLAVFSAALFSSLEGLVVVALCIFFGTRSSPAMSAVFIGALFVVGRMHDALTDVIARKLSGPVQVVVEGASWLIPALPRFDLTAITHGEGVDAGDVALTVAYAALYTIGVLSLAAWRFARRDLL